MLGRLFKYEMKATAQVLIPIYIAALIIAAATRTLISFKFEDSSPFSFLPDAGGLTFFVAMVAVFVITIVVIVWRFYRALSSGEGYLLFTLPVKTDSIILSELLCSLVWSAVMLVTVLAAALIMTINMNIDGTVISFSYIMQSLSELSASSWSTILLFIFNMIIAAIEEIICIYCAISLASLFKKYRLILSVTFYIAIVIVKNTINISIINLISRSKIEYMTAESVDELLATFTNTQILTDTIFFLFIAVAEYFVVRYILTKHLNIE